MTEKINLLDFDRKKLIAYFAEIGEPAFRATQVIRWVHQLGVTDFAAMTNLSKKCREYLTEHAEIRLPEIVHEQVSLDGTRKWLLKLHDGQCIETVLIPENDRGTLCVSSQVGCIVNCQFCSTARQGFNRNLSIGEIIGQVRLAVQRLSHDGSNKNRVVTNVVMMGMGEPLLNFDNVVAAMELMKDDIAYNLSKYRVTLSTSGIVPAMFELAKISDVSVAVSLHAANDTLRDRLVPINKKYPLDDLMAACREFFKDEPKRSITYEYVMLKGVNDSEQNARELARLLRGMKVKINLIPFNPFPNSGYECSDHRSLQRFRKILLEAGYNTITRKTRGDDISAACGQLVGQVVDKSQRKQQWRGIPIVVN